MAKSNRGGKRNVRPSRGHISYKGRKENVEQTQKDLNVDYEEAERINNSVNDYTGGLYSEIRDVNYHGYINERNDIEKYISKAPVYNGEIYRGIHTNDDNFANSLQKGATIDMKGISSWSSSEQTAGSFASRTVYDNTMNVIPQKYQVVFSLKNKSGVSIRHISSFPEENEVLHSSKTKFKIKKVTNTGSIYKVELSEV